MQNRQNTQNQLQERTKAFALAVIRFVNTLPRNETNRVIGRQLLRSATSVGANYRAACRGRSAAEFRAKLGICEEEADESCYWRELLIAAGIENVTDAESLLKEANEITAMVVASINTSRRSN
jgi:four helix bundle protein